MRSWSTWRSLGKCMTATGSGDGALVQLATCNGGAGQNWTAQSSGALVSNGRCLDASGGSTANGTQLIIWSCHGGTNQRWTLP